MACFSLPKRFGVAACSHEGIALEMSAIQQTSQAKNTQYQPLFRVHTSSEIQKSRVFQGCFTIFSRAFPGFLEVQNEKQHSQRIVITIKQQCAPSVAIQY